MGSKKPPGFVDGYGLMARHDRLWVAEENRYHRCPSGASRISATQKWRTTAMAHPQLSTRTIF